jgi:hypothetical protein
MNRRKLLDIFAAIAAAIPLFGKKKTPDVPDEIKATQLPGDPHGEFPKVGFIILNAPSDWTIEKIEDFEDKAFTLEHQVSRWSSGVAGAGGVYAWKLPIWLERDGTFSSKNNEIYKMREVSR